MISCVTSHHYVLASSVWFEAVLALLTVTFYLLVYFHAGGLAWGYLSHKLRPGFNQDALQLVLVAFDIFSSWLGHVRAEDKGRNRSRSWTSACMLYKWLHLLFFKSHDLLQLKFSSGWPLGCLPRCNVVVFRGTAPVAPCKQARRRRHLLRFGAAPAGLLRVR